MLIGRVAIKANKITLTFGFLRKTAQHINTTIPQLIKYLKLFRVWVKAELGLSNFK